MKVYLIEHSTKTISPTDANWSNGMRIKAQLRSPGVLVRDWLHFTWVEYSDQYVMMLIIHRYLVNWTIASFWVSGMWRKACLPGFLWLSQILLCRIYFFVIIYRSWSHCWLYIVCVELGYLNQSTGSMFAGVPEPPSAILSIWYFISKM
jgi:hypothetical protein